MTKVENNNGVFPQYKVQTDDTISIFALRNQLETRVFATREKFNISLVITITTHDIVMYRFHFFRFSVGLRFRIFLKSGFRAVLSFGMLDPGSYNTVFGPNLKGGLSRLKPFSLHNI